jgi:hypothetical protein
MMDTMDKRCLSLILLLSGSLLALGVCKTPTPPEVTTDFALSVGISPAGGGTVARSPDRTLYTAGTVVTITANPATDYQFTRWEGAVTGATNPATVTMNGHKSVTAIFTSTVTPYTLTVTVSPAGGGSVAKSPDQTQFAAGAVVTLTASPASGYQFTRWQGGATGTANPTTITMNGNTSVTAVFTATTAQYTLTVAASPTTGGSVAKSPDRAQYAAGTVVTLTANPASGYQFTRWEGGVTGTANPATVTMNANANVTAVFTAMALIDLSPPSLAFTATYGGTAPGAKTVSITNGNGGTLSGLTRSFPDGVQAWLEATLSGPTAPATLTVQVSMYDQIGHPYPAGTYTSRIAIASPLAGNSPQDIAVTFTVLPENTLTAFAAYDNTVTFSSSDASMANTVFGSSPLAVGYDFQARPSGYDYAVSVGAVRFDVQSQIQGRGIARATLRVFVHTLRGDLSAMPLIRVNAFASDWNPFILTWNAWQTLQVQDAGAVTQPAPSSAAVPLDFDVTAIVRNWASSTWGNYGFQLYPLNHSYPGTTSLQTTLFQSLESFHIADERPQLIIEFQ